MGVPDDFSRAADFERKYRAAFDAFLVNQTEANLRLAYELGRDAVTGNVSALDIAAVHHEALGEALRRHHRLTLDAAVACAGEFLAESLSAFEMVRRGYLEERERAFFEQRQAGMLRQLSTLLSDVSLAAGAAESLVEVLQLVAEQARELTRADVCFARTSASEVDGGIEAAARESDVDKWSETDGPEPLGLRSDDSRLKVPILSLAGAEIGALEVWRTSPSFSELDEAILVHVAQMTAATVERARLYRHK
jgi:GAF domain-containing protein